MRKLWILPIFLCSAVWADKTYEVRLNSNINLRAPLRETGGQEEVAAVSRTLPKGSVIRVSEENYKKVVMLSMKENKEKFRWMQGIEVVSIPGESAENVEKMKKQTYLMSHNLVVQTGKVISITEKEKEVELQKPTPLYKQAFRETVTNEEAVTQIGQANAGVKALNPNAKCANCDITAYSSDSGKLRAPTEYLNQQAGTGPIQTKEQMLERLKSVSRAFTQDTANDPIYEFDPVGKQKAALAFEKTRIATKAVDQALDFINQNFNTLPNRRYVTIIDYTKPSNVERGYIFDLETGTTTTFYARQGRNPGDPPKSFSNQPNSNITPRGFHVVGDVEQCSPPYYKASDCRDNLRNKPFMRLHGQEGALNNNSGIQRGILIHPGGDLTSEASRGKLAQSNGCPSMDEKVFNKFYKTWPGSLYFMYSDVK